jgi:hypothetical protein
MFPTAAHSDPDVAHRRVASHAPPPSKPSAEPCRPATGVGRHGHRKWGECQQDAVTQGDPPKKLLTRSGGT